MLELALGTEVVTPDGGHVASNPRDEEEGCGEVVAVAEVEDPFSLENPGDVALEGVPQSWDQQAEENEDFAQVHGEDHGEGKFVQEDMYRVRVESKE